MPPVKIYEARKRPVNFGVMKGKLKVPPEFDEPLPDEVLAGFEGRSSPDRLSATTPPSRPAARGPRTGRAR